MDSFKFLNAVLPNDGWYCIVAIKQGKINQKFYNSLDVAVHAAHQFDSNGFDTYFALATFKEDGKRTTDNAYQLKSFFLDLDCGEGKEYPDQAAALDRLKKFVKDLKLPKPITVNSGRGIHVYWHLKEAVSYDEWLPVAERLKKVTINDDMPSDKSVTADGARILRVPQTHNYKDDPPKDVEVLSHDMPELVDFDEFAKLLGDTPLKLPSTFKRHSAKFDQLAMNLSGANNASFKFKLICEKTLRGTGCNQIKHIMENQAEIDEPLWRAGLSIAKHCEDHEKAAEMISKDYPGYDEDETYNKMDLIKRPYVCERFNEYNPGICEKCPHWRKIKTPLSLGRYIERAEEKKEESSDSPKEVLEGELMPPELQQVETTLPDLPHPYFRGKNNGIYIQLMQPDGEAQEICIYDHDLYAVCRIKDPELGHCALIHTESPKDGPTNFVMPNSALTSTDEFRKILSAEGIIMRDMRPIKEYLIESVRGLQWEAKAEDAVRQFGWHEDYTCFVAGDRKITVDKILTNHPSAPTYEYFPYFKKKGTLEGWKELADFFNRDGMEMHQFAVGAGFGSMLMSFMTNSNICSAAFHIWHEKSGQGKSSSMAVAGSIWGNYQDLNMKAGDTKNFQFNRSEAYKNLPLCVDEITNLEGKILSNMVLDLCSQDGKQRGRMGGSSNRERVRGEPWALLAITTGNDSITESIHNFKGKPMAEAMRVLEWRAEYYRDEFGVSKFQKGETNRFNHLLSNNYGWAGEIFVQYVLANMDSVVELLTELSEKVRELYDLSDEHRFWTGYITCTLAGIIIAKQCGLLRYDVKKVKKWVVKLVKSNKRREATREKPIDEYVEEFLSEHANSMLITKDSSLSNQDAVIDPNTGRPYGKIVARFDTSSGEIRIAMKAFSQWLKDQHMTVEPFIDDISKSTNMELKKISLLAGSPYAGVGKQTALVINAKEKET
jgi:hypothetical protein